MSFTGFFFSLGPLVCKVKDHQVEVIVDTLCNNMIGDKEQLRDISSIGLKTVINELPLTTQTLAATGNLLWDIDNCSGVISLDKKIIMHISSFQLLQTMLAILCVWFPFRN